MSPPVTVGDDCFDCACVRAPVSIQPRADAPSARERSNGRPALEIVPLVLVEGSENFRCLQAPDFAADAAPAGEETGILAQGNQGARHGRVLHERDAILEEVMRGLAAHQGAVQEDVRGATARGQAA